MSTGVMGADLGDLAQMQRTFSEVAGQLRDCQARINGIVHSANWTGSAADQFRGQWDGELSPSMTKASEVLDGEATYVAKRSEAIRIATSVAG
jgi:uncharacterized protein YukE